MIMRQNKIYLLLLLLSLSGCGTLTIGVPQPGLTYADPLAVSVSASADIQIGSVVATLDGRDVSSDFVFDSGSGTRSLSAVLQTTPGSHALTVSANVWNGWYRTYDPKSAQVSFTTAQGGSIALTISPQTLTLAPGTSQPIAVSITRGGAFQGDVTVSDGGSSIVIPAPSTTGTLNIGVGNAYPGEYARGVSADGRLHASRLYSHHPLRVRVGHQPGPFARALIVASSANQTVLGPDNLTTLSVQNGPPGTPRFEARFRQPTGSLGAPIGFEPGTPVSGGAGFCPRAFSAFVISGGSATVNHTATFLFLDDPLPRIPLAIPATAAAGGAVVEPTLFFSKNCAIVIAIGADTSTQQAFRAQVYDLYRRKLICSIPFNAAPTSLQALLDNPANDNQKLTVTVGGQSTDCLLFP